MTSLSAVLGVAGPWGTWGCCLGARRCAALQEGGLRGLLSPTGLCAPGDLWPAQPVCVTGGFGCALESGGPATRQLSPRCHDHGACMPRAQEPQPERPPP